MRSTVLLLLIFTLTFSRSFSPWAPGKRYDSKEIVHYRGDYYISMKRGKSSKGPDQNRRWRKIPNLRNPDLFRAGYSYPAGHAAYYRGITFIASNETESEIPGDSSRNWTAVPRSISTLPPMPDPEEDTTIAGIDSNGDGIRDDIEIAIVHALPDDPEKRAALMASAKGVMIQMETYCSTTDPAFDDMKLGITLICAATNDEVKLNIQNSHISTALDDIITNTPERYLVTQKASRLSHGETIPVDGFAPYRSEARKIYDAILAGERERGTLPALKTLPPMPNPEEDTTIVGIDSNGDGIRDDIEIAVVRAAPDNPVVRAKLLTKAKGICMQMEVFDSLENPTFEDLKLSITVYWKGLITTPDCNAEQYLTDDELSNQILNTPERYISFNKSDHLLNAKLIPHGGYAEYRSEAHKIYDAILARERERGKSF